MKLGLWVWGKMFSLAGTARLWKDERGLGTMEIMLIAAVLIIIAFIFKEWIVKLINYLTDTADGQARTIFDREDK